MTDSVHDLIAFLDAAPTPYHAVAEARRRLAAAGFRELHEADSWSLAPGDRCLVSRGGGSLIAFEIGQRPLAEAGIRAIGAHTDSPGLRLKPEAASTAHGLRQLAVEPYGGVLLHTWLDRELGVAGRVSLVVDGVPQTRLVDLRRPLARIPNLAIHLQREIRTEGLRLNEQTHLPPVYGLESAPELQRLVADALAADLGREVAVTDLLAWDLLLHDLCGASVAGAADEFLCSARLDNLASTHAGLSALVRAAAAGAAPFTRLVALHDHEEVGSRSATGAAGSFLLDVVDRLATLTGDGDPQARLRALAQSRLVSADMAHAVHPNHADRHEPGHRPKLGGGPVIKVNANQSYASDAETAAEFALLCRNLDVPYQHFVTRSDLACGSTIGPISAARVGLRTVDVGNPMLAMHSCREMAATADVEPMIRVLAGFFGVAG
jgi:aspartyl aminopeptidase